jgi:hypothetical protein
MRRQFHLIKKDEIALIQQKKEFDAKGSAFKKVRF